MPFSVEQVGQRLWLTGNRVQEALTFGELKDFDPLQLTACAEKSLFLFNQIFWEKGDFSPEAKINFRESRTAVLQAFSDWAFFVGDEQQKTEFGNWLSRAEQQAGESLNVIPGEKVKPGHFAFIVHPRDVDQKRKKPDPFNDIVQWASALNQNEKADFGKIRQLFNLLPPFIIDDYKSNEETVGKLVVCPLTLEDLARRGYWSPAKVDRERGRDFGRERLRQTALLLQKMNIPVAGLGEILAAITDHASWLNNHADFKDAGPIITTGHAMTTEMIIQTMFKSLGSVLDTADQQQLEQVLKQQSVTIIGGGGAIGWATAVNIANLVKQIVLEDRPDKLAQMEGYKRELLAINPQLKVEIITAKGGKEGRADLEKACKMSKIIVGAASVARPIITSETMLNPGTILIGDWQPPGETPEVAKSPNLLVVWPIAMNRFERKFLTGLYREEGQSMETGRWGCENEIFTLAAYLFQLYEQGTPLPQALSLVREKATIGPVTGEKVMAIRELAKQMGTHQVAELQRYGERVPETTIIGLRRYWQ